MDLSDQGGMPRARIRGEQRVTPLELFFNLVSVFALTQGAEALRGQGTGAGEASAGLLQLKEEEAAVSPE
jgi:low temperature requirement protein LtrA